MSINRAKVITICGSLKFMTKMMEVTEKLELNGNCVLSVVYPPNGKKKDYTLEEEDILDKMHIQKIDMSDAIFVVNVENYIGSSTRKEIEYAKNKGKEIIYLEEE